MFRWACGDACGISAATLATDAFAIEYVQISDVEGELRFRGNLRFAKAAELWDELRRLETLTAPSKSLDFELSGVQRIDGGAMALLACLRAELHRRGVKSEFVTTDPRVRQLIHLYGGDVAVKPVKHRRPLGTLDQVGRATIAVLLEVQLVLAFFGQMVLSAFGLWRSPRSANWREVPSTMERSGADAVPIVVLINFLVGLAMSYQAAAQLKRFGANLLVADLIGISVCRELGPLMTAIVVCGRSGAAFGAELGFMQVNEEIDALRTMGFGPMQYLVLPRALALVLVMPLLTLLADAAGIAGGLVVGVTNLDLTVQGFMNEALRVVTHWDVWTGVLKSMVFALAIALIACQQGLATTGGAEGVGRRTTSTVVVTLFTLILTDATMTVLFRAASL
jgi:phospholipid/cholesterol/gamma-HCH transport system permease protein